MTTNFPLLSFLVLLPSLGALCMPLLRRNAEGCRLMALAIALLECALALVVAGAALGNEAAPVAGRWLRFEDVPWIAPFGIRYTLGLDGLSLPLVLLTALIGVMAVLVSWRQVTERVAGFHAALLVSISTVLGVFLALDLVLFALFWELQLVPVFFLIGVWGHGDRVRAALKFVLFSATGGLFMFLAVIGLGVIQGGNGQPVFALDALLRGADALPFAAQAWLFAAFLLSFGVKLPLVPVHTWLPDAHTQAPTAGSLILAALLLKTGGYALLRFAFPLFPAAAHAALPLILFLAVAGLFYASWIALAQRDLKRMIAYSSIGHMGLSVVGAASWDTLALSGAALLFLAHGLATGGLFALAGMVDERFATRDLDELGGLWNRVPVLSAMLLFYLMASAALPGSLNFIAEITIFAGAFAVHPLAAVFSFGGVVASLAYLLRLARGALFGPPGVLVEDPAVNDLSARELAVLLPPALLLLAFGLHPQPILDLVHGPLAALADLLGRPGLAALALRF